MFQEINNTDILWRDISDLRNFLIHAHDEVDMKRVWRVVKDDVPELKNKIRQLYNKELEKE